MATRTTTDAPISSGLFWGSFKKSPIFDVPFLVSGERVLCARQECDGIDFNAAPLECCKWTYDCCRLARTAGDRLGFFNAACIVCNLDA
jgi:hypothetical protein